MRTTVLGVGFDNLTLDEAVAEAFKLISKPGCAYAVTPNPEIVWMCREDRELKEAVSHADLVVADGVGIVYGAKILKTPLKGKVPGIDFGMALLERMAAEGMSVFLLGSRPAEGDSPSVADRAAEALKEKFPGLVIAGTRDGYFSDDAPIIDSINECRPDLTLVCLGGGKQEKWMLSNKDKLDTSLMIGLGGTLDVLAGEVQRAPERWQRLGLEWLYRLFKQPQRIGRMMSLPKFLFAVIGEGRKNDAT